MRCRSCNVLAMGKRVTQIALAVVGVNEVNCLGMLGCGMLGQLLIGYAELKEVRTVCSINHSEDVYQEKPNPHYEWSYILNVIPVLIR